MELQPDSQPVLTEHDVRRFVSALDMVLLKRGGDSSRTVTLNWQGKSGTLSFNYDDASFTMEIESETSTIHPDGQTEGDFEGMTQWFVSADNDLQFSY